MNTTALKTEIGELDFPVAPSFVMDFEDFIVKQEGNTLKVGYLADDLDGEDPMVCCDGQGHLFTAHRHARDEHPHMQEALALDADWQPDLELLSNGGPAEDAFRKEWIRQASIRAEFCVWAESTGRKTESTTAYLKRRATAFWKQQSAGGSVSGKDLWDFSFSLEVATDVWSDLVARGVIGNRDAVSLDCYEHSGTLWSISGTHNSCHWDTARRAGVWVPDELALDNINHNESIYAFGNIEDMGRGKGWKVTTGESVEPEFATWADAWTWLVKFASGKTATAAMLETGRDRARTALCQNVLDEYNAYLAGECYGIVVATFENVGTEDDPEWETGVSDEVWGYIGTDWAVQALNAEFH